MASGKPFTILKSAHTGITVSSLSSALKFWVDLLGGQILYCRSISNTPEFDVQGIPDATFNMAMVSIGGYMIELLEYTAPSDKQVFRPRPCDVGNVHVALDVQGMDGLIEGVKELGWTVAGHGESRAKRNDGSEWRFVYVHGPEGETVEFMEKLDG